MWENFHIQKSYWQQAISRREQIQIGMKATVHVLVTSWLFYRKVWICFFLIPLWLLDYKNSERELAEKKCSQFLIQFRDMIQSVAAALNAGYSAENSIREAQKEMDLLYTKKEMISEELKIMVRQMRVQIPMEYIFEDFAKRVDLEDVTNFSVVFSTAKRSGGNMLEIIQNTVRQIGDKIEVKREIDTILAAKTYEFKVMSWIPYVIIAYMQLSFPEFTACLYDSLIGIGVMTVCLLIYESACVFGKKLIKIDV